MHRLQRHANQSTHLAGDRPPSHRARDSRGGRAVAPARPRNVIGGKRKSSRFARDGPADRAGVLPEDVLLALNGQNTPDYPSYQAASFGLRAGDKVELQLRRQSESVKLQMTIGTRSPSRRFRDYLATSMGLLFVFLGFITFLRRDDALGRLFYAICILFAILLLDLPTFPWVLVMGLEELLRNASGLFCPPPSCASF